MFSLNQRNELLMFKHQMMILKWITETVKWSALPFARHIYILVMSLWCNYNLTTMKHSDAPINNNKRTAAIKKNERKKKKRCRDYCILYIHKYLCTSTFSTPIFQSVKLLKEPLFKLNLFISLNLYDRNKYVFGLFCLLACLRWDHLMWCEIEDAI